MYKKILILYFLMIQSLLSQHYQSIHQQQLEYYNIGISYVDNPNKDNLYFYKFIRTKLSFFEDLSGDFLEFVISKGRNKAQILDLI